MPRVHHVMKARKDYEAYGIKKGDEYYWWKFRFGPKMVSKTPPRRSQLTRSYFLSQMYEIEDRIQAIDYDSFESEKSDIISDLESLRDEQQDKRDNMPYQLQDVGSGEILQNRYDAVEEMISELDGCTLDEVSESDIRDEVESDESVPDDQKDAVTEERIEGSKQDALANSGINDVSYGGE